MWIIFASLTCGLSIVVIAVRWHQDARLNNRINRMKSLIFALENFQDVHGRLPLDDPSVGNSWRFELLPYTLGIKQAQDFSKPWSSDDNLAYRNSVHPDYCNQTLRSRVVKTDWGRKTRLCTTRAASPSCPPSVQILIVEFSRDTEWHWMQQGDTAIKELPNEIHASGVIVCGFADGKVWALRSGCANLVQQFAMINSFDQADRTSMLAPFRIKSL